MRRAVAEALDAGRLWGYGADVFTVEPPPPDHPLIGRPDVMLTPHSAAQTEEGLRNMATMDRPGRRSACSAANCRSTRSTTRSQVDASPRGAGTGAALPRRAAESTRDSDRSAEGSQSDGGLRDFHVLGSLSRALVRKSTKTGGLVVAADRATSTSPSGESTT